MVYCAISGVRFPCLPSVYNTKSQSSFNGDPLCRKGLSFFSKKDPSSCNSPFYFSAKGFAFYFSIYIYIYIYINGFDSWSMILFAVKMLAGKSSYDSDSPNLAVTTSTATTTTTPTPEKVLVTPDGNASEDPLVCLLLVHVLHTTFMTQAVDSQFRVFCIWKQIMF